MDYGWKLCISPWQASHSFVEQYVLALQNLKVSSPVMANMRVMITKRSTSLFIMLYLILEVWLRMEPDSKTTLGAFFKSLRICLRLLAPFLALWSLLAAARFSHSHKPPRRLGVTWSMVVNFVLDTQYLHQTIYSGRCSELLWISPFKGQRME